MLERVRVRRRRPAALSWALAACLTALCVYLITLGVTYAPRTELPQVEGEARVTEEVVFEPLRAYLVSLGSYATGEEARIEAARNAARGAAGYLVEEGSSTLVLGALYFDAGQARTVADNLAQSEDLDAGVVVREAERVRLRVTATGAQIDCLRSTQAELCQTAAQMADLALQLDRAETDAKSARTLLNVAAARLEDRERALRSIPGAQQNPVCSGLLALVEQFRASLFVLSGENSKSTLSLSGEIKYNVIEATLFHIGYLRDLNGL